MEPLYQGRKGNHSQLRALPLQESHCLQWSEDPVFVGQKVQIANYKAAEMCVVRLEKQTSQYDGRW